MRKGLVHLKMHQKTITGLRNGALPGSTRYDEVNYMDGGVLIALALYEDLLEDSFIVTMSQGNSIR